MSEELNALNEAQEQNVDAQNPDEVAGEASQEEQQNDADNSGNDGGEPGRQTREENHQIAEFRKNAQAEINRLREEKEQRDQLAAMLFENTVKGELNPFTGKPIETVEDFLAWKEEDDKQKLEQAGLSPDFIKEMIANDPTVKAAAQILQQNQQEQQKMAVDGEIGKIQVMNPKIKGLPDLIAEMQDNRTFNALTRGGMTLSEAYAEVHKIPQKKQDNTKDHLQTLGGGNPSGSESEIPADELSTWKEAFPDDTSAQLRTRYNRSISRQK